MESVCCFGVLSSVVRPVCLCCFFFNDTATTEIYTLSLHDALPSSRRGRRRVPPTYGSPPRAFLAITRSEEHTSELQSRRDLVCRLLLEKKKIRELLARRAVQWQLDRLFLPGRGRLHVAFAERVLRVEFVDRHAPRLQYLFFFNDTATTEIYTLSLHDALPIPPDRHRVDLDARAFRKAGGGDGRRSEEHTSELQSRRDLVCRLLLEKKKAI